MESVSARCVGRIDYAVPAKYVKCFKNVQASSMTPIATSGITSIADLGIRNEM